MNLRRCSLPNSLSLFGKFFCLLSSRGLCVVCFSLHTFVHSRVVRSVPSQRHANQAAASSVSTIPASPKPAPSAHSISAIPQESANGVEPFYPNPSLELVETVLSEAKTHLHTDESNDTSQIRVPILTEAEKEAMMDERVFPELDQRVCCWGSPCLFCSSLSSLSLTLFLSLSLFLHV